MCCRHRDIMFLHLLSLINLITTCASSTQIRVNSSNNLIYSIKSLIRIHQRRCSGLNVQSTCCSRNAIWKSDFFLLWFLVARLLNYALVLAPDAGAVVLTFFGYLVYLLVAAIVLHLAKSWALPFSLFRFWSKIFSTTERILAQRCLV